MTGVQTCALPICIEVPRHGVRLSIAREGRTIIAVGPVRLDDDHARGGLREVRAEEALQRKEKLRYGPLRSLRVLGIPLGDRLQRLADVDADVPGLVQAAVQRRKDLTVMALTQQVSVKVLRDPLFDIPPSSRCRNMLKLHFPHDWTCYSGF